MTFTEELSINSKEINKLVELCKVDSGEVAKAAFYALEGGGKRLRPLLMLTVCKMLGGDVKEAEPFAVALEMIHNYSLIHDDLPCMDDDDLRRGRPTCHVKYGEAIALLAGDALLNGAYEMIASSDSPHMPAMLRLISECAGYRGMIGGQELDMKTPADFDELVTLHRKKTGALIRAAVVGGAILGNATEEERAALERYADALGLAFQVCDDLLDVVGTEEELGKPIGSDAQQGKVTYYTLFGEAGAKEKLREYSKTAHDALSIFGDKAAFLLELTDYLEKRRS